MENPTLFEMIDGERYERNGLTIKGRKTERGFKIFEFCDLNAHECSLQESSLATENAIWLGIDEPKPQIFVGGQGWTEIPLPEGTLHSGRMHLTLHQVRKILPLLQYFVEHNELPDESGDK